MPDPFGLVQAHPWCVMPQAFPLKILGQWRAASCQSLPEAFQSSPGDPHPVAKLIVTDVDHIWYLSERSTRGPVALFGVWQPLILAEEWRRRAVAVNERYCQFLTSKFLTPEFCMCCLEPYQLFVSITMQSRQRLKEWVTNWVTEPLLVMQNVKWMCGWQCDTYRCCFLCNAR